MPCSLEPVINLVESSTESASYNDSTASAFGLRVLCNQQLAEKLTTGSSAKSAFSGRGPGVLGCGKESRKSRARRADGRRRSTDRLAEAMGTFTERGKDRHNYSRRRVAKAGQTLLKPMTCMSTVARDSAIVVEAVMLVAQSSILLVTGTHRSRVERIRKNCKGVAILRPVFWATAGVKCFVLWLSSQSGCAAIAERSTGTSAS